MVDEIVWTKRALQRYQEITEYLQTNWGEQVTREFVQRTYRVIDLIRDYPEMGTMENKSRHIRGFLVTKHNRLFYRGTETQVILLNFFDTRSGKEKA